MGEILEEWLEERRQTRRSLGLLDDERQLQLMDTRQRLQQMFRREKTIPSTTRTLLPYQSAHKAIMRYIPALSDPGDIVFDGFAAPA